MANVAATSVAVKPCVTISRACPSPRRAAIIWCASSGVMGGWISLESNTVCLRRPSTSTWWRALTWDRKSVVKGKSVDLGGRRIIKKKKKRNKRKKKGMQKKKKKNRRLSIENKNT